MDDENFISLMIHTCTIVKGLRKASAGAGTGAYGHKTVPITVGGKMEVETSYPIDPCLCRPQSDQEIQTLGKSSENTAYYVLYLPFDLLPATLREVNQDATSNHQVWDVYDQDGDLYDPGPFDIDSITQPAGRKHHYQMTLRRTIG